MESLAASGVQTRNVAVRSVTDFIQRAATGQPPNITVAHDGGEAWQDFAQNVLKMAQASGGPALCSAFPTPASPTQPGAQKRPAFPADSERRPRAGHPQGGARAVQRLCEGELAHPHREAGRQQHHKRLPKRRASRLPACLPLAPGPASARPGRPPLRARAAHLPPPPHPPPLFPQFERGVWEYVGRSQQQLPVSQSAQAFSPRDFYVANLQPGPVGPETRNEDSMLYDVYSEEWRRLAMDGAIATGLAFSSDFVQLVPDGPMVDGKITRASSLIFRSEERR